MQNQSQLNNQIQSVSSFEDLAATPFQGEINAVCWNRNLIGDFAEIVAKFESGENMTVVDWDDLLDLQLSEQGNLAREQLLKDLKLLGAQGASPILNVIKNYDRDQELSFFPTDVYSFHVDRSPAPTATYLCTYQGAASEILPNAQGIQKILIPEIRAKLQKLYNGPATGFDNFLSECFFDLHYQAQPNAKVINLGVGNLWKLAVDHPQSEVLPCLHRAPMENLGESRLLLIC